MKAILFILTKKTIKKQDSFCIKVSLTHNTSVQQVPQLPISQQTTPYSVVPSFSKNISTSDKDQANGKHSVNYHPSPFGFISRIPRISIAFLAQFLFSEILLNFPWKPPWLEKFPKSMVFRFLENASVSQKIESKQFYSCYPQAKLFPRFLSSPPRQRVI